MARDLFDFDAYINLLIYIYYFFNVKKHIEKFYMFKFISYISVFQFDPYS